MEVQLAGIADESVTDGPGVRIAIFFQGCRHHCAGCHNPQTWDFDGGSAYEVGDLLRQLPDTPLIQGVTLSGGDPFYQPLAAARIAEEFHARGKDVWAYTGFVWEDLVQKNDAARLEVIRRCDVLVDGPFVQALRRPALQYRGSANQRLIRVRESLAAGEIVEWSPGQNCIDLD
ncbi:MAG TPA: anaerobic ribonucleoside-triphosphate reductase activating protein [Longilinea sp.]|nr:anaerobic ribonucleoside-triphosphate reductase activating protein [Longilinea sp.]